MEEIIEGVKVFFISRNIKITDYIKNYFKEKFSKIVSKIPEEMRENATVYLIQKKEGETRIMELILTIRKSNISPIYTSEEGDDPRTLIDKVVYEIERQLDKIKTEYETEIREKMKTKREITPEAYGEELEEQVIGRSVIRIEKPMSVDDAIAILEDIERRKGGKKLPFYVFSDFDGKIKILYKQGEKKYIVFEIQ